MVSAYDLKPIDRGFGPKDLNNRIEIDLARDGSGESRAVFYM